VREQDKINLLIALCTFGLCLLWPKNKNARQSDTTAKDNAGHSEVDEPMSFPEGPNFIHWYPDEQPESGPSSCHPDPRARADRTVKEPSVAEKSSRPKSNLAQMVSAFVAAVALIAIYFQVNLARINALRASARQVYLSYSQATLQYPQLAKPNYRQLKENSDPTDLIRYQIYVANMLTAYDEILQIIDEPEWIAAFDYDITDHMPYLCEQNDPNYYAAFYKKTRDLIAEQKKKYCTNLDPILRTAPNYPAKSSPKDARRIN
jgi:hypothetical protein